MTPLTLTAEPLDGQRSRHSRPGSACVSRDPKSKPAHCTVTDAHQTLNMSNGALFGAPIPSQYEAVGQELQSAVEQAVTESEENGMNRRGKEVTPWLLARVAELTRGKSLASSEFLTGMVNMR